MYTQPKISSNRVGYWRVLSAGGAIVFGAGARATDERDRNNRVTDDVSTSCDSRALLQSAGLTGAAAEAVSEHWHNDTR